MRLFWVRVLGWALNYFGIFWGSFPFLPLPLLLLLPLHWLTLLTVKNVIDIPVLGCDYWWMFAKVFSQIFDSSIAENYELRHFFEDMLKLADLTGVVDMTPEAISRRINLPLEKVVPLLHELGKPDLKSRSKGHEGRRIIPLDSHREWGWIIVNYQHYRSIRDEAARREYNRDAKQRERAKKKSKKKPESTSIPNDGASVIRLGETHGQQAADDLEDRHSAEREEINREVYGRQ